MLSEIQKINSTVIVILPNQIKIVMGRTLVEYYKPEVKSSKQSYYNCLPEKAKRHFLGQEYLELGKGSQSYLSRVFGCARDTIIKGYKEVKVPGFTADYTRQRSSGGGRKKRR